MLGTIVVVRFYSRYADNSIRNCRHRLQQPIKIRDFSNTSVRYGGVAESPGRLKCNLLNHRGPVQSPTLELMGNAELEPFAGFLCVSLPKNLPGLPDARVGVVTGQFHIRERFNVDFRPATDSVRRPGALRLRIFDEFGGIKWWDR